MFSSGASFLATAYPLAGGSNVIQPPALTNNVGSIYFNGTNSYMTYMADEQWNVGGYVGDSTGDFTIEWSQYRMDENSFPRIFSMGTYDSGAKLALSIEGSTIYLWANDSQIIGSGVYDENHRGQWVNYAIWRNGTSLYMRANDTTVINTNFAGPIGSNDLPFMIGAEEMFGLPSQRFGGYITDFRFTKGVPPNGDVYNTPTVRPTDIEGTQLLLLAESENEYRTDSSSFGRIHQFAEGTSFYGATRIGG